MPALQAPVRTPPPIDEATRRDLLKGIGALGAGWVLAGCDGAARRPTETRTVEGMFGPVEIPVQPERVMALYTSDLDLCLALELPVAASTGERGRADTPFPAHLPAEAVEGIERIATYPEIDLERLAATRPDLIVGGYEEVYDQLAAIAPTFAWDAASSSWQDSVRAAASALDRVSAADAFIGRFEAAAAAVRIDLDRDLSDVTVAHLAMAQSSIVVHGRNRLPSQVLVDDLGCRLVPVAEEGRVELSFEQLGELADVDVFFVGADPGEQPLASVAGLAVWEQLPGVRADGVHVHSVDLNFPAPHAALALLDEARRALAL